MGITNPKQVILADTSIYEGLINIDKFITSGAAGIIPKASQGNWMDVQFKNTWANAKGRTPRGCYHFFDPRYSPTQQANEFISLVKDDLGELPLVVDWEAGWTGTYSSWSNLYAFLVLLRSAFPDRPIYIYTGYYYWLDHSPNPITQAASLAWFGQFGLWLAWYTNDPSIVKIPKPWTSLKWWQYSESGPGSDYGTQSGAIDLNYYWGTTEQFEDEYHLSEGGTPPPPDTGGTTVTKGVAKTGTISNIKTMVSGVQTGIAMKGGDYVYGTLSPTGSDIINFDHFYRADGSMVSLLQFGQLCKVTTASMVLSSEVEPTPPPPPPSTDTSTLDVHVDLVTNAVHIEKNTNGVITKADVTLS